MSGGGWADWSGFGATQVPWYENFGMSRMQRYIAFGISLATTALLFILALLWLPVIAIAPSKFVTPFTLGSLILFMSFGFLHGFYSYAKH